MVDTLGLDPEKRAAYRAAAHGRGAGLRGRRIRHTRRRVSPPESGAIAAPGQVRHRAPAQTVADGQSRAGQRRVSTESSSIPVQPGGSRRTSSCGNRRPMWRPSRRSTRRAERGPARSSTSPCPATPSMATKWPRPWSPSPGPPNRSDSERCGSWTTSAEIPQVGRAWGSDARGLHHPGLPGRLHRPAPIGHARHQRRTSQRRAAGQDHRHSRRLVGRTGRNAGWVPDGIRPNWPPTVIRSTPTGSASTPSRTPSGPFRCLGTGREILRGAHVVDSGGHGLPPAGSGSGADPGRRRW